VPDKTLRALAEEYWDVLMEAHPVAATVLGDHRFDDRIEDLSAEAHARLASRWDGLLDRLGAIDRSSLTADDLVTYGQLAGEIADYRAAIDQRLVELQSDQMTGYHIELLQSVPVMSAPDAQTAAMLVQRFRRVPEALDRVVTRFVEGLRAGRTPPAICITRSLSMIEGYLASPLHRDVFVTMSAPAGMDGEAEWRRALTDAVRDCVRPAYQRTADAFREQLLPGARDDDHCGLSWLADGDELYATLVAQHTSLDLSPDEIHRIGMEDVTQVLPAEYAEVGGRLFGITDPAAVLDRLRTDPSLRYRSGDEIMEDARTAFEAAGREMPAWFGRMPKSGCEIEPVPEFLAPDSPAAYYYPPPGDGSRGGVYYVNTDSPRNKARYETASVAFHEAIPGHHLQLAIAMELDGLPRFRRFSLANTAYVEGWGLYSERLAEEMGLYRNDLERLGMLAGDSVRSCRLVVDTGLHAMGWTRAQAIEFMAANTPVSVEEVTVEVDRYIGMPGQALAYKLGQREIFRLREAARDRLGEGFDIKGFHDAVLGSGSVRLPLLGELVEAWVAPRLP
jgi:uncharacterized protein (DUF885 family)